MRMFVIYDNPSDYPGKFVVRQLDIFYETIENRTIKDFYFPENILSSLYAIKPTAVVDTLDEARSAIPAEYHTTCFPRDISDDPIIVETWV